MSEKRNDKNHMKQYIFVFEGTKKNQTNKQKQNKLTYFLFQSGLKCWCIFLQKTNFSL